MAHHPGVITPMERISTVTTHTTELPAPTDHVDEAFALLAADLPLTLLLDLALTVDSHEIYDEEPGSSEWLKPVA
jgi:hypothetical protein